MKANFSCWKSCVPRKNLNVWSKGVFIYTLARQMRQMATKTTYTCAYATFSFPRPILHVTLEILFFHFQFKFCADCASEVQSIWPHKNGPSTSNMHHLALRPRNCFFSFLERWVANKILLSFNSISYHFVLVSWAEKVENKYSINFIYPGQTYSKWCTNDIGTGRRVLTLRQTILRQHYFRLDFCRTCSITFTHETNE